jgi:glutamate synthase (NADPH/NADH) small chain
MGKLGAFLHIERRGVPYRDALERARDYQEFLVARPVEELRDQGARCMDCGVPFCHNGCPLGNLIPDWNDLVYRDRFKDAIAQLHATNNFPEFTGRLCPAPCEAACVLEIREGDAVTIKQIENAIINRAFEEGWVTPQPPRTQTGQSVAVVGSGPAGMAAAQQLRRAGHRVVLFERDEAIGGLVRFGVPDFKIEKAVVERRVQQLAAEGVELRCGVDVGSDIGVEELRGSFDAVVLATGSRVPRDLPVPGRELDGVHFAMDYLYQRNRWVAREFGPEPPAPQPSTGQAISAEGLDVVVIGGGDTGADCVGNVLRERARSVTQLELLPEPPQRRSDELTPWPQWPLKYRLSYAMEEVQKSQLGEQDYSVVTTGFREDGKGGVAALKLARAEPQPPFGPVAGTERELPAQLVLLAMGFLGPEPALLDELGVERDARGNIKDASPYASSVEGVFAAGDARRGQSLIVWAINEGRQCARMVDRYLSARRNGGAGGARGAIAVAEDAGLAGHASADEGPEGPPAHAGPGVGASE